jgi:transcriptional regulator with XRE-family HTH domain
MTVQEIKDKIKLIMRAKKVTQAEIATKLGISQNMVSLYLAAKSPGIDKVLAILEILDISPAEFFREDENEDITRIAAICPHCGKPLNITIR